MNIFKIPQINAAQEVMPLGNGLAVDNIAGKINLDPESLKLLQEQSLEKGLDFEQVLQATQEGKDPNTVMSTMLGQSEAQTTIPSEQNFEIKNIDSDKAMGEQPQTSKSLFQSNGNKNLKTNHISQISKKNNSEKVAERVSIFDIKNDTQSVPVDQVANEEKNVSTRKSIFNILGRDKNNLASRVNQINQKNEVVSSQKNMPVGMSEMGLNQKLPETQNAQKELLSKIGTNEDLVNLNQFMSQQSPTARKNIQTQMIKNAYRPVEKSLFDKKIEESLPEVIVDPKLRTKQTLQDAIVNSKDRELGHVDQIALNVDENVLNFDHKKNDAGHISKTFQVDDVQKVRTPEELIEKIQDYVIQTKVGKNPEVQMAFEHKDLGRVDLLVHKNAENINVAINTHANSGHEFFTRNQTELVKSLHQSGIQLGEFKIEVPMTSSSSNSFDSFSKNEGSQLSYQQQQRGQHHSQSGERESDARRRQELWNLFQEKEVA